MTPRPTSYLRARWIARERTAARLVVELAPTPLPDDLFAYPLDDTRLVEVSVETPPDVQADGRRKGTLVPGDRREGLRLTLWSPSGAFHPRISVVRGGELVRSFEVGSRSAVPPTLSVEGVNGGGGYQLRFRLDLAPDGRDSVGADPVAWTPAADDFKELYSKLYTVNGDPVKMRLVVEALGAVLFEQLLPRVIRDELVRLSSGDVCGPLLVRSTNAWFPWEFVRVQGGDRPPRFLCEAFDLTRWAAGPDPPRELTLRQLGLIISADARLPTADAEKTHLLGLRSADGWATEVAARSADLRGALGAKPQLRDWWHFVGHGQSTLEDGMGLGNAVVYLDGGDRFTDAMLSLVECQGCGVTRPFVFWNACDTGHDLAWRKDVCGWARQFVRLGAAAFVGTLWEVKDRQAWRFARQFYHRLLRGVPVGRAVRQAREAIRTEDTIDWLFYTVYADPWAAVREDCRLPGNPEEYDGPGD